MNFQKQSSNKNGNVQIYPIAPIKITYQNWVNLKNSPQNSKVSYFDVFTNNNNISHIYELSSFLNERQDHIKQHALFYQTPINKCLTLPFNRDQQKENSIFYENKKQFDHSLYEIIKQIDNNPNRKYLNANQPYSSQTNSLYIQEHQENQYQAFDSDISNGNRKNQFYTQIQRIPQDLENKEVSSSNSPNNSNSDRKKTKINFITYQKNLDLNKKKDLWKELEEQQQLEQSQRLPQTSNIKLDSLLIRKPENQKSLKQSQKSEKQIKTNDQSANKQQMKLKDQLQNLSSQKQSHSFPKKKIKLLSIQSKKSSKNQKSLKSQQGQNLSNSIILIEDQGQTSSIVSQKQSSSKIRNNNLLNPIQNIQPNNSQIKSQAQLQKEQNQLCNNFQIKMTKLKKRTQSNASNCTSQKRLADIHQNNIQSISQFRVIDPNSLSQNKSYKNLDHSSNVCYDQKQLQKYEQKQSKNMRNSVKVINNSLEYENQMFLKQSDQRKTEPKRKLKDIIQDVEKTKYVKIGLTKRKMKINTSQISV